jgi:hypothetical protein
MCSGEKNASEFGGATLRLLVRFAHTPGELLPGVPPIFQWSSALAIVLHCAICQETNGQRRASQQADEEKLRMIRVRENEHGPLLY